MITQDFDYDRGVKVYDVGNIITIIGDTSRGERHIRGIVANSWDNGSFSVITPDGFIGLGERVRTEPTGEHFDLSPLFERLKANDLQEAPEKEYQIGDIIFDPFDNEPAVVFYVFDNGDIATLASDGMHLGSSPDAVMSTGERFDLTPMFDRLRGV